MCPARFDILCFAASLLRFPLLRRGRTDQHARSCRTAVWDDVAAYKSRRHWYAIRPLTSTLLRSPRQIILRHDMFPAAMVRGSRSFTACPSESRGLVAVDALQRFFQRAPCLLLPCLKRRWFRDIVRLAVCAPDEIIRSRGLPSENGRSPDSLHPPPASGLRSMLAVTGTLRHPARHSVCTLHAPALPGLFRGAIWSSWW